MIRQIFIVIAFSAFPTATLAGNSLSTAHHEDKCDLSINADETRFEQCLVQLKQNKDSSCFERLTGMKLKVSLVGSGAAVNFTINKSGLTACLNEHKIRLSGKPAGFSYNLANKTFSARIYGGFRYQNFTITGDSICGLKPGKRFAEKLDKEYSYIPLGSPLTIGRINCLDENTITSSSVTLNKDTEICGALFPTDTTFSFEEDEHYHFTSSKDLKLTEVLPDGNRIEYVIKKDIDYRNKSPALHPCKWTATQERISD